MPQTLTPSSPQLLETLENMIAPGGRARLSPYVETTQFRVLFELLPDPKKRRQGMGETLRREAKRIDAMARYWADFCKSGKQFDPQRYSDPEFLQSYLIYYSSVNIVKVQLCLLDLLRAGELQVERLHVVDIGLGAGSTFIAVLDFLAVWKTACNLYSVAIPTLQVQLTGLDQSPQVAEYTRNVLQAYREALAQRGEETSDTGFEFLKKAAAQAELLVWDIAEHTTLPDQAAPNLLVASNVYNELTDTGNQNLTTILTALPEGAVVLMLEPGDQQCARRLMGYRAGLSATQKFNRQGPCGQEHIGVEPNGCGQCWSARRQAFHQSALYLALRQAVGQYMADARGYDQFENTLLSWSNIWLRRGTPTLSAPLPALDASAEKWPEDRPIRYVGKYNFKAGFEETPATVGPDALEAAPNGWVERWKFCGAGVAAGAVLIDRKPGLQLPALHHGELLQVSGAKITRTNGDIHLDVNLNTRVVVLEERKTGLAFLPDCSEPVEAAINEIGYRIFGFPAMRDFQHRILARTLTGRSILGIAATGSGKSECFILPAMALSGVTIVVSPLVSLMTDQYDQRIRERYGLDHLATFINSTVAFNERQARLRRLELGYYKLVYFTPEQLERGYILDSLRRADRRVGVRYLAMDEAHCVSQWGHDFRPSYLNLLRRVRDYGVNPVCIALTATASTYVRRDVCEELGLNPAILEEGGDVYVESSNRPELNFIVEVHRSTSDKVDGIVDDLQHLLQENKGDQAPGAAIVFLAETGGSPEARNFDNPTPNQGRLSSGVTSFASYLERRLKQRVAIYHGKMESDEPDQFETGAKLPLGNLHGRSRRGEQTRFIRGETPIMVATKGFGMGIDKDNVRLIIHRTPPSNLEAYAQEAGRAGRDGKLADVVLYYSPDAPEEDNGFGRFTKIRSDHEIQSFFLSEKYVRRQDVLVVRAFLRTVSRRVGKNLYFTNDEAIEFFDRCSATRGLANLDTPFAWPAFPVRGNSGYESADHAIILDRGHQYQCKTNYINRILQALYRVRPYISGLSPRAAFLEQLQETGAELFSPEVISAAAIVNSNAYFGEKLRDANLSASEFVNLIQRGTLIPLAEQLNQSLYETEAMLRDIKFAEGKLIDGSGWQSKLLNFKNIVTPKFGPAAGLSTLSERRDYAGAYKRATTNVAYQRAKAAGRPLKKKSNGQTYQDTILNDWFDWSTLPNTRGWEITPGPAFEADERFDEFLRAFMALHDQRKENDWAAYNRLITDYIGVRENGAYDPDWQRGNCLRAVLLGYLETFEVVVGDNCYSCSRCVRDGNYAKHTLEERRNVVVRMIPAIAGAFENLKRMTAAIPSEVEQAALFDGIAAEEAAGRSLRAYFSGWSGRMLDQTPGHRAAMWLRLIAMADDLIPLHPDEFLSYAHHLREVLAGEAVKRLQAALAKSADRMGEVPEYWDIVASLHQKQGQAAEETDALNRLGQLAKKRPLEMRAWLHRATSRLCELFGPEGPQPNPENYVRCVLLAGRTAERYIDGYRFYSQIAAGWGWADVENEIATLPKFNPEPDIEASVFLSWLAKSANTDTASLCQKLKADIGKFSSWPEEAQAELLGRLPRAAVMEWPEMLEYVLERENDPDQVCEFGLRGLLTAVQFPQPILRRIAKAVNDRRGVDLIEQIAQDVGVQATGALLDTLAQHADLASWDGFTRWLSAYPAGCSPAKYVKRLIFERAAALTQDAGLPDEDFLDLALSELNNPYTKDTSWDVLVKVSSYSLAHFQHVFKQRSQAGDASQAFGEALLEKIVENHKAAWICQLNRSDMPTDDWRNIQLLALKATTLKQSIQNQVIGPEFEKDFLDLSCSFFDWQNSIKQADMLAAILKTWKQYLNPNWKTPLARLAVVLVAAGRNEAALRVAADEGDLHIPQMGKKLSVEEYIRQEKKPSRHEPIIQEYELVAQDILEFEKVYRRINKINRHSW